MTRLSKLIDWPLVVASTIIALAFIGAVGGMLIVSRKEGKPKECLDYTLREFREGEAPEKCAAEVYGDQF